MEQSFLAYLRGRARSLPQVAVGIGDDAAVIDFPPSPSQSSDFQQQVACTDQIIDGVDFDRATQSLASIGYKAVAINLSDIAAMGATPTFALVTLALPQTDATEIAGGVYEGILRACGEFGVAVAGGDLTTYEGPLAISVSMMGTVTRPWLRSGAREGDAIFVSGVLGGSISGKHLQFTPRIELARRLREHVDVHAAIDVSDGFSLDLDRLLAASRLGGELNLDAIPISDDAIKLSETSGRTPLQHAWSDGEDFELIFTTSEADAAKLCGDSAIDLDVPVTRVGKVVGRTGLWKRTPDSKFERVFPQGFIHEQSGQSNDFEAVRA